VITLQQETLSQVWDDVQPMLLAHYEELTVGKARIKLAPDRGRYEAMERDGGLAIYTARDDGRLVGYSAFFLVHHMHYRHNLFALNDVFYLDAERRNDAWLGFRFLRYIDRVRAAIPEIDTIKWHVKVTKEFGPMLKRLGYAPEETIWSKVSPCPKPTDTPPAE
jgi:hypothetical protein